MNYGRKSIAHVAVKQKIKLNKLASCVFLKLIVKRSIAAAPGLQLIEEVIYYLIERQFIEYVYPAFFNILHILKHAALFLTKLHYCANIFRWRHYRSPHHRLLHIRYFGSRRKVGRIIYHKLLAVSLYYFIYNGGRGCNKVEVEFPFEPFLYYLHMQQTQKAAPEAEAERHGGFRLV